MRLATPAWGLVFLFVTQSGDSRARIENLRAGVDEGQIVASFELENAFDEDVIERVQTGLPTGFDFTFKIVRPLPLWPITTTRSLDTTRIQAVAMYNAVTREYLVNYKQDGELINSRVVLELAELREAMTRFENLALFSTDSIASTRRLHVKARAAVGSRSLLFLIPTTVKTDWAESERFRLSGEED